MGFGPSQRCQTSHAGLFKASQHVAIRRRLLLSNTSINFGLTFAGGGYRAMLTGAGAFAAYDNRTVGSTEPGHLGGLVQAATYVSGLSGASWLLGSIVANNFTTIEALLDSKDVWDLSNSIFNTGGINIFSTAKYYDKLVDDVDSKRVLASMSLSLIYGVVLCLCSLSILTKAGLP